MESKQNIIIYNNRIYSFVGIININMNRKYNSYKEIYDGYYIELDYGKYQKYINFLMKDFSDDLEKTRIECNKLYNKIKKNMK